MNRRCRNRLVLIMLGLCFLPQLFAGTVSLSELSNRTVLGNKALYLEDPGGLLSLQELPEATTDAGWRPSVSEIPSHGFNTAAFWFYTRIESTATENQWLLEIGNPLLDEVDVFILEQDQLQSAFKLGDSRLFEDRPIYHRNFISPLTINSGQGADLYIRVRGTTAIQVPMTLWKPKQFLRHDQGVSLWHWVYFGLVAGIAIYNFFLFLVLRDRSYLYYVLFILSVAMYFACMRGFVYQYGLPDHPIWNERALPITVFSSFVFASLFAISFLRLKRYMPNFYYAILGVAILGVVGVMAGAILPFSMVANTAAVLTLVSGVLFFVVGVAMIRKDYQPARYFAVAWAIFLTAIIVFALAKLGLIERTALNDNAPIVGSALEALLLSFGLAARFNLLKERARIAERKSFKADAKNRTKRMRAMRTLISGVAHQFNTPLGNGVTAISMLQDESQRLQHERRGKESGLTAEQTGVFLQLAVSSSGLALQSFERAANLVKRFKQVAIDDFRETVSAFQMQDSIKSAIAPLKPLLHEEGIEVHWDCPDSMLCTGFPATLAEILSELINNAVGHAFHDPHDAVEHPPLVDLTASCREGLVSITVADNGVGIAERDPFRVLDPFYSTKRGTGGKIGLGLYVVHSIVTEQFSGQIDIADSGAGATVSLTFAQHIS